MMNVRLLLRFFDKRFILKVLLLAFLYSLVPLLEIYLLFFLGGLMGNVLTLVAVSFTSLLGVLMGWRGARKNLLTLRQKVHEGKEPGDEVFHLIGILIGGVFLLTPGFMTDVMGFLLFFPAIRNALGRWLVRKVHFDLRELYEYLRLYDY